jgi:hypothetical protein
MDCSPLWWWWWNLAPSNLTQPIEPGRRIAAKMARDARQ